MVYITMTCESSLMSDKALSTCPACRNELQALPPPNRCPHCGFDYDDHTRVWLACAPTPAIRSGFYLITTLFLLNLTCDLVCFSRGRRVADTVDRFACSHLPLGALAISAGLSVFAWPRRGVALTSSGVWLCTGRRRQIIPWQHVEGTTDWPDGKIRIKVKGKGIGMPLQPAVSNVAEFGSHLQFLQTHYSAAEKAIAAMEPP